MSRRARKNAPEPGTDEYWFKTLPKPPRPALGMSDHLAAEWMQHVVDAGGVEGLRWVFKPDNWPYPISMRPRLLHVYGRLQEEAEDQAKARAKAAARDTQADIRRAANERRRAAGWA